MNWKDVSRLIQELEGINRNMGRIADALENKRDTKLDGMDSNTVYTRQQVQKILGENSGITIGPGYPDEAEQ